MHPGPSSLPARPAIPPPHTTEKETAQVQDTANIYSAPPDNDTMGGRMLRARDAAGLSLNDVAARLGVRKATVQGWENDRSQPRANKMQMIAGVLNVSLSWLLHGVGTGPVEDEEVRLLESMTLQFERLKRMQRETQMLASRIESDIQRLVARTQAGNAA